MKICQLCAVDFTMEKFLLPLIDGLQEEGDEVVGVCSDGEFVPGMRARGYRIDTMPISRSMHPLKHLRSIWVLIKYFQAREIRCSACAYSSCSAGWPHCGLDCSSTVDRLYRSWVLFP